MQDGSNMKRSSLDVITGEITESQLSQEEIDKGVEADKLAFDALNYSVELLESVEGIEVETISSSCCGMAGAFGYQSENYDVSMQMAELSLLPRIRKASENEIVTACGTSCRQQIKHGSGRSVDHPISILRELCIN